MDATVKYTSLIVWGEPYIEYSPNAQLGTVYLGCWYKSDKELRSKFLSLLGISHKSFFLTLLKLQFVLYQIASKVVETLLFGCANSAFLKLFSHACWDPYFISLFLFSSLHLSLFILQVLKS